MTLHSLFEIGAKVRGDLDGGRVKAAPPGPQHDGLPLFIENACGGFHCFPVKLLPPLCAIGDMVEGSPSDVLLHIRGTVPYSPLDLDEGRATMFQPPAPDRSQADTQ